MTNLRERNVFISILLVYVTCGIYGIYIFFALGSEIKNEGAKYGENLAEPIIALLLSIVTCGIYGLYYIYKQAETLKKIGDNNNVTITDPVLVTLLTLFIGIGVFINIHSASTLAKDANTKYQSGGVQY